MLITHNQSIHNPSLKVQPRNIANLITKPEIKTSIILRKTEQNEVEEQLEIKGLENSF